MSNPVIGSKPMAWPSTTGPMDLQSAPDRVPWGRWRSVTNVRAIEHNRASRREGWRQFGWQTGHANCDLRNQHGTAQKLTSLYLHPATGRTDSGNRLYAGSGTEIWRNRVDGGWKNVLQNIPEGTEWSFASLNQIVVAANGRAVRWQYSDGDDFAEIPSLALIGVTGAAVTWVYENTVFLADLELYGAQVGNGIVWAHLNSIDFDPSADSVAGSRTLGTGERILAAFPTGSTMTIMTTHGAWRLGVVDGQFAFQRLYYSKTKDACPVGRRAMACNRDIVFYLASDGIYAIAPYSSAPEFVEWASAGLPREFLRDRQCLVNAAGYDPSRNEIWFSSEELGLTYAFNPRLTSSSIIDRAFTAILYAQVDRGMDTAMFWVSAGICSASQFDQDHPVAAREDARLHPVATGTADGCTAFDPPCDECDVASPELVVVSATDNTLKTVDDTYFARDTWTNGVLVPQGYTSAMITGALSFGTELTKRVSHLGIDFTAQQTDVPRTIIPTLRCAGSAFDPASVRPGVRAIVLSPRSLSVPDPGPTDSPNFYPLSWTLMTDSRFLSIEFRIPECTGGSAEISNFVALVSRSPLNVI